ncbi:MAG: Immunoglobulin I-set domain protein [Cyanobacteria bacterium RYN_339]|nr:Immunoglobulin I-set domain protein [Cyanobacteria bacterium RYN_339]
MKRAYLLMLLLSACTVAPLGPDGLPVKASPGASGQPLGVPSAGAASVPEARPVVKVTGVLGAPCSTLGGSYGNTCFQDGAFKDATFDTARGLTIGQDGAIYILDEYNRSLRRASTDGQVTTLAGNNTYYAYDPSNDGTGKAADFRHPQGIVSDPRGPLWITEDSKVRRVTLAGEVTTVAGGDATGYADGTGADARFNDLRGVAIAADGSVVVCDRLNNCLRRITSAGEVTTLAGAPQAGSADGPGGQARFYHPTGVALAKDGLLYVTDTGNHLIRRVARDGTVSTFAGSGGVANTATDTADIQKNVVDGPAATATFGSPELIAADPAGNLYVDDLNFTRLGGEQKQAVTRVIRRVAADGSVVTVLSANDKVLAGVSNFTPGGLMCDGRGNLFITMTDKLENAVLQVGF